MEEHIKLKRGGGNLFKADLICGVCLEARRFCGLCNWMKARLAPVECWNVGIDDNFLSVLGKGESTGEISNLRVFC